MNLSLVAMAKIEVKVINVLIMASEELLSWISVNPNTCFGSRVIAQPIT